MTKQDINAAIIAMSEFPQGSPLPYTVLNALPIVGLMLTLTGLLVKVSSFSYQTIRHLLDCLNCKLMAKLSK